MEDILKQIAHCVEFGKLTKTLPIPRIWKDGRRFWAYKQALDQGVKADRILKEALVIGWTVLGRSSRKESIYPADADVCKSHERGSRTPETFFMSGEIERKGNLYSPLWKAICMTLVKIW